LACHLLKNDSGRLKKTYSRLKKRKSSFWPLISSIASSSRSGKSSDQEKQEEKQEERKQADLALE